MKTSKYYKEMIDNQIPSNLIEKQEIAQFYEQLETNPKQAFEYIKKLTNKNLKNEDYSLLKKNLKKFDSLLLKEYNELLNDIEKTREISYAFSESIESSSRKQELENAYGTNSRETWENIAMYALNNINKLKETKYNLFDLDVTNKIYNELSTAQFTMKNLSSKNNNLSNNVKVNTSILNVIEMYNKNELIFNKLSEMLYNITQE